MGVSVTRTLAEIEATTRKAARGHGCPWGLAEEAGKAARWLASHGLPATDVMVGLLSSQGGCCCKSDHICALKQATVFADCASDLSANESLSTDHPLLFVAQMGRAADALDHAFLVEWPKASASIARTSLNIDASGDILAPTSNLTCRPLAEPQGTPPSPASRPVTVASWQVLSALAKRILVPASSRSRDGAGAGNSDND